MRYNFNNFDEYKKIYHQELKDVVSPNIDTRTKTFRLDHRMLYVSGLVDRLKCKTIIDFGCGDGVLCFSLAEKVIKADGVEINSGVVDYNNEYAAYINSKCRFYHSSVEEFVSEEKYDAALLMDVLEHSIYPQKMLKAAEDSVNNQGHIIVSTPAKDGCFGDMDINPQHINLYSEERLQEAVGKNRIVDFVRQNDIYIVTYKKVV